NYSFITGPGSNAGAHGIFARSTNTTGSGDVSVWNAENIHSTNDGINAVTLGAGDVFVHSTWDSRIYSNGGGSHDYGIIAENRNTDSRGNVYVTVDDYSSVYSKGADGIHAATVGHGNVSVFSSWTVSSPSGDGIEAATNDGHVYVHAWGI